jgi:hypothetical protein
VFTNKLLTITQREEKIKERQGWLVHCKEMDFCIPRKGIALPQS